MRCAQPGCGGTILADGYCDTCGAKAATPAPPGVAPVPAAPGVAAATPTITPEASAGQRCGQPGCGGTVLADGYCDTCGARAGAARASAGPSATAASSTPPQGSTAAAPSSPAAAGPPSRVTARSLVTGSARARGSRRTASARTRTSSRRSSIGAGLLDVPPAATIDDPRAVVMEVAEVEESKRFCSKCGAPVGRGKGDGRPGRQQGFCGRCRNPFDFVPKLGPGDLVAGQYEVVGALAHGGLGWIYLARDRAVSDRWVVLKGLLDAGDEAATAAAVAERRFLAQVEHPNIVEIYNFVTHQRAGYIVMEYVGGPSLKQLLKQRREANGGKDDPLPVDRAIAFVLAVLPAFTYLHSRGLVYCDFKPDNLIQVGDQMKLIDLGGVRRIDDPGGDIYGTVGFQAPEIADLGPSVASDLYTIGRTLAVLTLEFHGYQSSRRHELPTAAEQPVLAANESFHRFLLKATAPHPDDRFQSTPELAEQLLGVLREVVASATGTPQPAASGLFAGIPTDGSLPALTVEAADPAAGFLGGLPSAPLDAVAAIDEAIAAGQVEPTPEVRLRRARALVDLGDAAAADAELDQVEAADPWEWRAVWLRGVLALAARDAATATACFDRCATEVPGELAPKLALALAAELAGDHAGAAARYEVVVAVDPSYVGAVMGLARARLAVGDVPGAIDAYGRVPRTHRAYAEAQQAAVRTLAAGGRFAEASALAERLGLDADEQAALDVELLEAALAATTGGTAPVDPAARVRGRALDERSLRSGLDEAYRALARHTPDRTERIRLIDRANAVRPRSLV